MPPMMRFSPPSTRFSPPSKSALFDPKSDHEIIVAKAKGQYCMGYMDRVDGAAAHVRFHVVAPTPEGEWAIYGTAWVNAVDIRYKVETLEEGVEALAEIAASTASPDKRVWLRGCPWKGPTGEGEITPAEHNMSLAKEFFGIHEKLAVGVVNGDMVGKFVEQLDTYFVRDVAFSVNQDSKPPGPSTSGALPT